MSSFFDILVLKQLKLILIITFVNGKTMVFAPSLMLLDFPLFFNWFLGEIFSQCGASNYVTDSALILNSAGAKNFFVSNVSLESKACYKLVTFNLPLSVSV